MEPHIPKARRKSTKNLAEKAAGSAMVDVQRLIGRVRRADEATAIVAPLRLLKMQWHT
jgi:hypothetical protein